ncbi:sigma-E factor negative regulatory protein [Stenotrophomonas sp. SY1]|uniref:sigma-E factor negative regulatory protein n=1 Tax=Stenotrophomonas sp. SY1 TaxID=477235 RepID=UPI001E46C101|nr:sigma-E factor negative regulatory protein [Stenotrophomonas sp. SY1]MCD9087581.1 sigma-E factor negative regulatory protein [Stenotrophomonas sp. SY1]
MNTNGRTLEMTNSPDKFELHYRQQLSALVDGELAADEARFMLRRLERDAELSACQERWQLLGDALRGRACAPAPLDFSLKVSQAIAADVAQHGPVLNETPQRAARRGWKRWGGGAALAASVAAVALFMAREQLPESSLPETVIATTAQVSPVSAGATEADGAGAVSAADAAAGLVAAAPAVAVAAARRQDATQRRGSATRTQQAARGATVARVTEPQRALAAAAPVPAIHANAQAQDPFAAAATLQARPWPRSTLSQGGALNASFPTQQQGGATFYPFEPRLPAQDAEPAEPQAQPLRR